MTTFTESYAEARGKSSRPRVTPVLLSVFTTLAALSGKVAGRSAGLWSRMRTTVMQYAALGSIVAGVWLGTGQVWGLVAAGLALLVAEAFGGNR